MTRYRVVPGLMLMALLHAIPAWADPETLPASSFAVPASLLVPGAVRVEALAMGENGKHGGTGQSPADRVDVESGETRPLRLVPGEYRLRSYDAAGTLLREQRIVLVSGGPG